MKTKIPSFENFMNESINEKSIRSVNQFDADNFIKDILKLGTKQNLFDGYIKKEGIDPKELNTLVNQVINSLDKNWR